MTINIKKYGVEFPSQLEIFKEKAKQTNLNNHNGLFNSQTKEYLEKRTKTWLKKYGVDNIAKIGLNQSKKILFDNIYFDSKWEVYYYFYLKDNNIQFEYHPDVILEYDFNGKKSRYLPDFKVLDRLVEIKGNHFFDKNGCLINPFEDDNGKSKLKQKCMEDNNVLILKKEDIKPFKRYFQLNNHL